MNDAKNIQNTTKQAVNYTGLLSAGQVVDTYFGWSAHITLVDESVFKFGQGIYCIRLSDFHTFSIGPEDVILPCR